MVGRGQIRGSGVLERLVQSVPQGIEREAIPIRGTVFLVALDSIAGDAEPGSEGASRQSNLLPDGFNVHDMHQLVQFPPGG